MEEAAFQDSSSLHLAPPCDLSSTQLKLILKGYTELYCTNCQLNREIRVSLTDSEIQTHSKPRQVHDASYFHLFLTLSSLQLEHEEHFSPHHCKERNN